MRIVPLELVVVAVEALEGALRGAADHGRHGDAVGLQLRGVAPDVVEARVVGREVVELDPALLLVDDVDRGDEHVRHGDLGGVAEEAQHGDGVGVRVVYVGRLVVDDDTVIDGRGSEAAGGDRASCSSVGHEEYRQQGKDEFSEPYFGRDFVGQRLCVPIFIHMHIIYIDWPRVSIYRKKGSAGHVLHGTTSWLLRRLSMSRDMSCFSRWQHEDTALYRRVCLEREGRL